jgi:low affinity Fe/Cu permease
MNQLVSGDRSTKMALTQLQGDNEALQSKLHNLVTARQTDKASAVQLEKRLAEERRARTSAEAQLLSERKAKKAEEANTARAIAMAAAAAAAK